MCCRPTIIRTPRVMQKENKPHWDLKIEPKSGWLEFNLNELWHYRDLLWLLVKRDFTAAYKQTILGPIWHFIQPIFTTIIFLVVFSNIARISTDGIPPVLFYMSGITLWNYFSSCLSGTSNTFVSNAGIFGKVYFPRLIMPLSVVISNLVRFGIQMALFSCALIVYRFMGVPFRFQGTIFLIPFLVIIMALAGLGVGILVSAVTTKYRDFSILLGFSIQLLMYASPIIYPVSAVQGIYAKILWLNPLTPIIETFRHALLGQGEFNVIMLLYSATCTLVLVFSGIVVFNRVEKSFMDTV